MPNRSVLNLLQTTYNKPGMKVVSSQKLVNMYLEMNPDYTGKPGMFSAIRTPGYVEYLNLTGNRVRDLFQFQDIGYATIDNKVYQIVKVGNNLTYNNIGTLSSSIGRLSTASTVNAGTVWCDGEKAYYYNGGLLTDITNDLALGALPTWVVAKDGFTLYLTGVENNVYCSDVNDPTTVNQLNRFAVLSSGTPLVSADVSDYYVYFFGKGATEVWATSGAQFVPFDRVSGGIFQVGIAAAHSSAVSNNIVYWLCQSKDGLQGIAAANGTQYQILPNPDFVAKVKSYIRFDDAFATIEVHEGHTFYILTFPTAEYIAPNITRGRTWQLDTTTGIISERQSLNTSLNTQDRYTSNCSMYFDGKQIIGDWRSGKLYEVDLNYGSEAGRDVSWEIISPTIWDRDLFFSLTNVKILCERGIALDGDVQGSDPLLGLRVSKDNGNSWGRIQYRHLGTKGDYTKQMIWGSLGGGRQLTLKIFGSDPIRWIISSATGEIMTAAAETPRSM